MKSIMLKVLRSAWTDSAYALWTASITVEMIHNTAYQSVVSVLLDGMALCTTIWLVIGVRARFIEWDKHRQERTT